MERLPGGKFIIREFWEGSGCSLSPLLGGRKLPVQPGKLVMLARKERSGKCADQAKSQISFCGLCFWQPVVLPSLAVVTTASPSGKKVNVRVTQDVVSMGFKIRLWGRYFFF